MKHFAGTSGLTVLAEDQATPANGMVAHVTCSYNSGYQNGDIKGAFLSDTDDTDLVGSGELVTNGTFDADTTGWTAGVGGVITYDAGNNRLELTNGAANNGIASQGITTVIGETYVATATVAAGTSTVARFGVGTGNTSASLLHNIELVQANGDVSITFVATTTTTYVGLSVNTTTSGHDCFLDNVSVKLADADRSVNDNGLIVNGTVTRTAVATGADLVAYSGFSASNYLEQPYKSYLDFGTGDFCVMGWMRQSTIASAQIVDRGNADRTSGNGRITVLVNTGGSTGFQFFTRDNTGTGRSVSVGSLPAANVWHFVCAVRVGGVQRLYVNGVEVGTPVANTADLSNTAANVYVGQAWDGTNSNNGSLALLRISATAPTADQIAKIYEDEKVLFQEGAQATLYGSSDAVTALAHDPVTDLLHVGTSAGRSVFSGLRRVSNTTTAVGTAISASNGLVAEE